MLLQLFFMLVMIRSFSSKINCETCMYPRSERLAVVYSHIQSHLCCSGRDNDQNYRCLVNLETFTLHEYKNIFWSGKKKWKLASPVSEILDK